MLVDAIWAKRTKPEKLFSTHLEAVLSTCSKVSLRHTMSVCRKRENLLRGKH